MPYYFEAEYSVVLNGSFVYRGNTNVFSLFNLTPNTEYTLTVEGRDDCLKFKTASESAAISIKSFGAVGDGVADDSIACQSAINCLIN